MGEDILLVELHYFGGGPQLDCICGCFVLQTLSVAFVLYYGFSNHFLEDSLGISVGLIRA